MSYPWDEGVDKSKAKNIHHAQSIFVRGVRRDFFGAYFSKTEHGVIHVSDYHEVEGKKIWHWGQSDDGKRWIKILTDLPNGQYAEIQSGRSVAEWEYEFLQPYRVNHLKEYWYPVRDIGSFVFANKQLAINFKTTPIEGITEIELALFATERLQEIIVKVFLNNERTIFEKEMDISPEISFRQKLQTNEKGTFQVHVLSGENILLKYDSSELIDNNPNSKEKDEKDPTIDKYASKSAELLTLEGSELEKFKYNIPKAREMYNKALEIDPGYSQALLNLGILDFKAGLLSEAQDKLHSARLRNPEDIFINYYLGIVYLNLGNYEAAEDHLWVGVRHSDFVPSLFELGRLEIIRHNYTKAIEYFTKVLKFETLNFKAAAFLSICFRKLNEEARSQKIIQDYIEKAPLDYLLSTEHFQLTKHEGARQKLYKFFQRDSEVALTISGEYMKLGLFEEGIIILLLYVETDSEVKNPMIYYYLSFAYGKLNEEEKARKYNDLGNKVNYIYVFPFHNYSIDVLKYALQLSPQIGRIYYYLGNLFFHKYRYEGGIAAWKAAVEMEDIVIAHRNLALAYRRLYNDLDNSEREYKKAILLNPVDFRYYCDLYEINIQQGKVDQIYDLFLHSPKTNFTYGRFLTRLAILHLIKNKVDEAIQILTGNEFFVMEGESNIHEMHIAAYLLKGMAFLKNKDYQQALESFMESARYPENHNVGRPEYATFSKINFFIGLSYKLQGENEKATEFFQKSAYEKVKPMMFMNLVFGTEPEPYSEADFYKILSLDALNKTEKKNNYYMILKRMLTN
jgi:tetratricopeptide (TPR) repeat protein